MKLVGAATRGSGTYNEDGIGYLGSTYDVTAAWVFDGVTGINATQVMPGDTDAAWIVARADAHLRTLATQDLPLPEILSRLIDGLIADFESAPKNLLVDYDPPAACLILVKRYGAEWKAMRLGDSTLMTKSGGKLSTFCESPNNVLDHWLTKEAMKRRANRSLDFDALLQEFRPQLMAGRATRNTPKGYAIIEAREVAKHHAEYFDLGTPDQILVCSDGYYRAVDHYQIHSDAGLIEADVDTVLNEVRAVEAADVDCTQHPRFKPADDASAILLRR